MTVIRPIFGSVVVGLLHLWLAAGLLCAATMSLAAEYDPALCPDAQATVAKVFADPTPPPRDVMRSANLLPRISCTICCQSPAAETEPLAVPAIPVLLYDGPRLAAMKALPAEGRLFPILRPPRG